MRLVIAGAGAWGTALAVGAARRGDHDVLLWARDAAHGQAMHERRENQRYLPGIALPESLRVEAASGAVLQDAAHAADLVLVATPVAGLRPMLQTLARVRTPLAWLCKGLERPGSAAGQSGGLMPHEVQQQVAPHVLGGAFSGPSFALEVARGQPSALVAASAHAPVRDALVAAFHGPSMRVYQNTDIVGVEVGGAVKNVLAIAVGLADGLELGLNARAALITRGLAEMSRFGTALGAEPETFMGLAGMGDLVLTATGDLSRNRRIGLQLAGERDLESALASLGHVAEGVYCAHAVLQRARGLGVEMPIVESMVALLDGRLEPRAAVAALMQRSPKEEAA